MIQRIRSTWKIFNEFYKSGIWFWFTIAVGILLFCAVFYLGVVYAVTLF